MCRIYIAWDFLFMGALESRHETELEGARSESRARRPPQTPPSGPALENRGAYVRLVRGDDMVFCYSYGRFELLDFNMRHGTSYNRCVAT